MMATVPHVTSGLGLRKFQADGFLLTRVYGFTYGNVARKFKIIIRLTSNLKSSLIVYSYFGYSIAHSNETPSGSALTIAGDL